MRAFQQNKLLSELSTFGIGGPARYFTQVETIEELQEVLQHCHEKKLPFLIIGKGSNSLFDDRGFDGLAILNKIAFFKIENNEIHVGGGCSFSLLGAKTARLGLSGLEFASGIPASVGGAIFMNAGANGKETCETLTEVTFVDTQGKKHIFTRDQMSFSYRMSCFQKEKGAIAAARFCLTPSPLARKEQLAIIEHRKQTQPLKEKSCGCIFRNPPGEKAGALIEKCGLKGKTFGGAKVSTLHGNFIINEKNASAGDVLKLAQIVQKQVKEKTGIELEMELRNVQYDRFSS